MAKPKDTNYAAWAKRIASLMQAAGITNAEELARRMRINRSTAYHWCNGTRIPSREMQPKLAKHLGTSVAALNGWAA